MKHTDLLKEEFAEFHSKGFPVGSVLTIFGDKNDILIVLEKIDKNSSRKARLIYLDFEGEIYCMSEKTLYFSDASEV